MRHKKNNDILKHGGFSQKYFRGISFDVLMKQSSYCLRLQFFCQEGLKAVTVFSDLVLYKKHSFSSLI
jgi:hypothetical protein